MADDNNNVERIEPEGVIRPSRRKKIAVVLTLAAAIVGGFLISALILPKRQSIGAGTGAGPAVVNVSTVRAVTRTIVISLTEQATVLPTPEVPVIPSKAGYIQQIAVKQGDTVKAGQTVAVLQPIDAASDAAAGAFQMSQQNLIAARTELSTATNSHAAAQASVAAATARLAQAKADRIIAENARTRAAAQVKSLSQAVNDQNADVDQSRTLLAQGVISRNEFERAQSTLSQTTALLEQAQSILESTTEASEAAASRIAVEEQSLKRSQASLKQAHIMLIAAQDQVERRRATANQAREGFMAALRGRKLLELQSPVAGTVSNVPSASGDLVTPSIQVLRVKPTGVAVVAFDATNDDAAKLKRGMAATVQLAQSKAVMKGKVAEVAPTSAGGNKPNRVFIEVADSKSILKPGKKVTAQVPLRKLNAIAVPKSALVSTGQATQVWITDGGVARLRYVTVASSLKYTVMVTSGLRQGDLVVVSADAPLQEGQPVVDLKS